MKQERPTTNGLSQDLLRKIAESRQEERASKEAWLVHHGERHPIYAPTNEKGSFVGLFGFATAVGARIFPYYQTESGVYFYEWEDIEGERKKTVTLDLERIQRAKSAIFYTPKSFVGDEPVADPGVIPTQRDAP